MFWRTQQQLASEVHMPQTDELEQRQLQPHAPSSRCSSELPLTSHHQAKTPAPILWVSGRRNERKEQANKAVGGPWQLLQGGQHGWRWSGRAASGCLWLIESNELDSSVNQLGADENA